MGTLVDLANVALSHLGNAAVVAVLDPPESTPEAEHCARFLPICRDSMLEAHPWKFALRRSAPATLFTDASAGLYGQWLYGHQEPADCVKVLAALPSGYQDDIRDTLDFLTESNGSVNIVLTKRDIAALRWTQRVTDPARWSPMFTDALGWFLASYVAGPLLKGDAGAAAAKDCYGVFAGLWRSATASDANQANFSIEPQPPWLDARTNGGGVISLESTLP